MCVTLDRQISGRVWARLRRMMERERDEPVAPNGGDGGVFQIYDEPESAHEEHVYR